MGLCDKYRFPGEDGQVTELELRPSWRLPLQEAPEEWDINPATEDLPIDQVLAAAADVRREHLAGWPCSPKLLTKRIDFS